MDPAERTPVTVVEDGPTAEPTRQERVTAADLMAELHALRADVGGAPAAGSNGIPEVRFVGDDPLPTSPTNEPVVAGDVEPVAQSVPAVHRPLFRHPAARRRRTDALA